MENTKNPQAYPTLFYNKVTGAPNGHDAGMTLRDYFAAKAMQAILTRDEFGSSLSETEAEQAYHVADVMLKIRANETI